MIMSWLAYALLLFKLLRPTNKGDAMIMVALVLLGLAVFMVNQFNLFAALPLAVDQRHDQMMLFLNLHKHGNVIAAIFFGLWLYPLGVLVFKSGYIPGFLSVFLMIGGSGYLILFLQTFLFPGAEGTLWTNPALIVTHLSELSLMLCLLIIGVNVKRWKERTSDSGIL